MKIEVFYSKNADFLQSFYTLLQYSELFWNCYWLKTLWQTIESATSSSKGALIDLWVSSLS